MRTMTPLPDSLDAARFAIAIDDPRKEVPPSLEELAAAGELLAAVGHLVAGVRTVHHAEDLVGAVLAGVIDDHAGEATPRTMRLTNLDLGRRFPAAFVPGPSVPMPERVGWRTADFQRLKAVMEQHFGLVYPTKQPGASIYGLPVFEDLSVPTNALDFVHPDGSRQRFTLPAPEGSALNPWDDANA